VIGKRRPGAQNGPMRKPVLLGLVLGFLSLLPAAVPRAAIVELLVDPSGAFTIQNSLSVGIGAVDLLATGATGFTPNPLNTGISVLDSTFVGDIGDGSGRSALVVNNVAGGVSIAAAGTTSLIGVFARVGDPLAFSIIPGDVEGMFLATLFDPSLNPLHPTSTEAFPPICSECTYRLTFTFVPEPAVATALALAALVLLGTRTRER